MSAIAGAHPIAVRDDSEPGAEDASLVIVCACGRSFVGFGGDRVVMADWQHRQHVHEASEAHSANNDSGRNHDTRTAPPVPVSTLWDSEIRSDLIRHIREVGALGLENARSVLAEAGVEDVQFNRVVKSLVASKDYYKRHGWLIPRGEKEPASPPPAPVRRELHPNDARTVEMHNAGATHAEIAAALSTVIDSVAYRVQRLRASGHITDPDTPPAPKPRPTGRYKAKPGRKPNPENSRIYRALRDGRNRQEIADEFGVTVATVHKIAFENGLATRRKNADIDPALIFRLADEGLGQTAIADKTGYSHATVTRYLRKWRAQRAA